MRNFLVFIAWVTGVLSLTWQEYRNIEFVVFNFLDNATVTDSLPGSTPAGLLRGAFHDAGTFSRLDGTGGANGCLLVPCAASAGCDRVHAANKGLEPVIQSAIDLWLDPRYMFNQSLSRADFFHLMGKLAVEHSSKRGLIIPFQTGRKDCTVQVPKFASRLPGSEAAFTAVRDLFLTRLGMSWTDAVALMGAHTLGRAKRVNTNHVGTWDSTPDRFDGNYYTTLLSNKWSRMVNPSSNGIPAKTQWAITGSNAGRLMLMPDVELVWDPTAQNGACQITQDSAGCPLQSTTQAIVKSFQTQSTFFSAFSVAFQKLQNNVLDKLSPLTGTDPGFGVVSPGFSIIGRNPPVATAAPVTTPTPAPTAWCYTKVENEALTGSFAPLFESPGTAEMAFATLFEAQAACAQIAPCTGVQDHSAFAPCMGGRCYTPRALTAVSVSGAVYWKRISC